MSRGRVASRLSCNLTARTSLRNVRHGSTNVAKPIPKTQNRQYGPRLFAGIVGGIVGGGVVLLGSYSWYHFSGVRTLVKTVNKTKGTLNLYTESLKSSSRDIESIQAIEWLRSIAKSYCFLIPGASRSIDSACNYVYAIRSKHQKEVDGIIKEAYSELKEIALEDAATSASALKVWGVFQKSMRRIFNLAGDAGQDVLNAHPALKDRFEDSLDQLKQIGDKLGPEAKKQVKQTAEQIDEVVKGGMRLASTPRKWASGREKAQVVQNTESELWDQEIEVMKPLLDQSPAIKAFIEKNRDDLKKYGDSRTLQKRIEEAVSTGKVDSLELYLDQIKKLHGVTERKTSGYFGKP